MPRLTHTTLFYALAGTLGGAAAWPLILALSRRAGSGLPAELALGALTGLCIGAFTWSHEPLTGRQFGTALRRAAIGAAAGIAGGALGAGLGTTAFSALGNLVAKWGGLRASLGILLAIALGWAVLGAFIGMSGGLMVRSRERALYGLLGGTLGGAVGGAVYGLLSATSIWSSLTGLALLGCSIAMFISVVEETFVAATVKVIKGRHVGRTFPLLKDVNILGRDDRSDVCLSGAEGVLVRHAAIKRDRGRFSIDSVEEGKPVYVNQKMTAGSRLADGDIIRVGSVLLLFQAVRRAAMIAAMVLLIGVTTARAGDPASVRITQFDLAAFPTVKAFVSVLDANGQPVAGLERGNVALSENGLPAAVDSMRMSGTAGSREQLTMAIVVDRSESMSGEKMEQAKQSVERFLSLMEPGDRSSLISFSDAVSTLQGLTGDTRRLADAAMAIEPRGHTALFDAVAEGARSLQNVAGRKAVIVLTDGIANRGALDMDQAIDEAKRDYASVYVIGLGADARTGRLERIAEETGGSYFFTPSAEGLRQIYETISSRIRNEYVITYETEMRAEYLRKVSLALSSGLGTESTYFQPRSSLFGAGAALPRWAFAIPFLSLLGFTVVSLRKIERHYSTGHLSVVRGKGAKKDMDIGKTIALGTDTRSTLALGDDNGMALKHAEIVNENGTYVLADKGSPTGTFVNKERIAGTVVLKDGDIIDVGDATIVFNEGTKTACAACGGPMRQSAKFCPKCGAKAE
jgi:VWFA-related protein